MTGNEPGTPGKNESDTSRESETSRQPADDWAGETKHGRMIDAEDASARETRDERARAAEAGDEQARAEQADAGSSVGQAEKPSRVRNAAEWLDGKLVPKLGGAEVGPYDDEPEESVRSHDACPLCGHPMAEHTIDRSTANAVLNCPAPQKPAPESVEPLNEVGMVKRDSEEKR